MNWKRKRDLTKAQMNLQLPVHALVADSPTRWGSMAKIVARILEQENAIRTVLSADRKASHLVTIGVVQGPAGRRPPDQ